MNNFQPYQTFNFQKPINGRMVNDLAEITPQEVPMNGQPSWFPSNDGSCVYMRAWQPNGTIMTVRYVPEQQQPTVDPLDEIRRRLDALEAVNADA